MCKLYKFTGLKPAIIFKNLVWPKFYLVRTHFYLDIVTAYRTSTSVGDPDPHVFGPPGSGSISQRYGSGSGYGSFPFLNVLSGLK